MVAIIAGGPGDTALTGLVPLGRINTVWVPSGVSTMTGGLAGPSSLTLGLDLVDGKVDNGPDIGRDCIGPRTGRLSNTCN